MSASSNTALSKFTGYIVLDRGEIPVKVSPVSVINDIVQMHFKFGYVYFEMTISFSGQRNDEHVLVAGKGRI